MGYALRPGLSFCETGDRLVFLDTIADRYFCLEAHVEQHFRELVSGSDTAPLSDDLRHTGLLLKTQFSGTPEKCVYRAVARESLRDAIHETPSPIWLTGTLIRLRRVRYRLLHGGLHRVLGKLRLAKTLACFDGSPDLSDLKAVSSNFEHTARIVRSHDQCLPRSIVLAHIAIARRLEVDLVIGVRLHPFAAHCWVQSGPWLLNDELDNTRTYTPVLTL